MYIQIYILDYIYVYVHIYMHIYAWSCTAAPPENPLPHTRHLPVGVSVKNLGFRFYIY